MEGNVQRRDWRVRVQLNIHSNGENLVFLQGNGSDLSKMFSCWGEESRQRCALHFILKFEQKQL